MYLQPPAAPELIAPRCRANDLRHVTSIELSGEPPARDAGGVTYRALRSDVPFAFVRIGAATPGTGGYEMVHEDGEPDGHEGATLIAPVAVPAGGEERFLAEWRSARDVLAQQRGYLGARLYRAAGDEAGFRFVAVARWSSPLMVQRATRSREFLALAPLPFAVYPTLYVVAPACSG